MRKPSDVPPNLAHQEIAVVTTKELISSITGQRDRHMLSRHLRDEESRYLGRIGKRFVVKHGQLRNHSPGFLRCDVKLRMLCPKMLSYPSRINGLVVSLLLKTNG